MFDPKSPFSLGWRADPQLLVWLWRFLRASCSHGFLEATTDLLKLVLASMSLFEEISSSSDISFGLERRGVLELFATSKAYEEAANRVSSVRAAGLRAEVLNVREVQAFEPLVAASVCGGLIYRDDCHLLPAEFVHGLASLAAKAGAQILENSAVTDFGLLGGRITGVRTAGSFNKVSTVVLAAGSYSPTVAKKFGVQLPVQPARGYSFTVSMPQPAPTRPIMFAEAKALVTPMGNQLRLGGVLELTQINTPVNVMRAKALVDSVDRYLLPHISFNGVEPWSGYRPCSPDGFPIVGWSGRWSNLLYAAGHGMLGLSLGPLTGEIIASLVMGETPRHQMNRLLPSRFGDSL
jgi:D-amino-acid dehydrogenase